MIIVNVAVSNRVEINEVELSGPIAQPIKIKLI